MDPDAALAALRELARSVIAWNDALAEGEHDPTYGQAAELAQTALALDEWLVRGGATPRAWARLYIGLGGQLDPPE